MADDRHRDDGSLVLDGQLRKGALGEIAELVGGLVGRKGATNAFRQNADQVLALK